jgi:hypothetical protein
MLDQEMTAFEAVCLGVGAFGLRVGRVGNGPDGAHFGWGFGLGWLGQIIGQAALLFNIGGDHFGADAGRVVAELAILPEDGDYQLRIAAGRDADKPDVGIGGMALGGLTQSFMAHDLGGARFAAEIDTLKMR